MLRRSAKNKYLPTQKLDQSQRKQVAYSVEKSHKKMFQGKKSFASDIEVMEDRPKKKKKVICIDPHDFSNKRLDDGIASKDNSEENKDSAETNGAEMSKNAQFRAIRHSSFILSFVEDNFMSCRRDVSLGGLVTTLSFLPL
ncbi:P-loop containing nucleoside triphosphate hydrolase superfamily protein [Forsythia ovata]|uniref:P-loop containing nucleoside triphosphate hydrolase superfamily protein n=1 Tax=Forsythia ovata TaxID=205694 RepID=A0ABD1RNI2_9LAMI